MSNSSQSTSNEGKNKFNFERSFKRLEDILELMNSGSIGLDDSLKLYKEADVLISSCSTHLSQAEQQVKIMMKNRESGLILDDQDQPQMENFSTKDSKGHLE